MAFFIKNRQKLAFCQTNCDLLTKIVHFFVVFLSKNFFFNNGLQYPSPRSWESAYTTVYLHSTLYYLGNAKLKGIKYAISKPWIRGVERKNKVQKKRHSNLFRASTFCLLNLFIHPCLSSRFYENLYNFMTFTGWSKKLTFMIFRDTEIFSPKNDPSRDNFMREIDCVHSRTPNSLL
jgi:hypothetical protein